MARGRTFWAPVVAILLATSAGAQPQPEFRVACAEGVRPEPLPLAAGLHTFHTTGCAIDSAADTDGFTFAATSGETIRLTAASTGGLEPRIELRAPGGALMADESCGPGPCAVRFDVVAALTGAYTVTVSDGGGGETGPYVLQLERLTPLYCPPVADASPRADVLAPATDVDAVRFDGRAGDTMRLTVAVAGSADPRLELLDPGGAPLRLESCAGPCTLTVDEVLSATGGFRALVSEAGADETGDYTIAVECLAGACAGSTAVDGVAIGADRTTLSWDPVEDLAATYDVSRGRVADLRTAGGFLGATKSCLGAGLIAPALTDTEVPAPGEGFFYTARATGGDGFAGTPDARWGPGQLCGRRTSLCRGWDCASAVAISVGDFNNTCGAPKAVNDYSNVESTGLCNSLLYPGPELIYTVELGAGNDLTATLTPDASTDLGLFFVGDCASPKSCLAYGDNPGPGSVTTLAPGPLAPGTYFIYVDSYYAVGDASCGEFSLELSGDPGAAPQLLEFRAE